VTEALLRGGSGELSGMQRQELSVVAGSSRRLSNLVNEILDYSKMKTETFYSISFRSVWRD
jgi:signal transduction histidine kinase